MMLEAGMPVTKAIDTAVPKAVGKLGIVFYDIKEDIKAGGSLSSAMAKHSDIFVPLDIETIRVGEASGNLSEILRMLSKWHENIQNTKKRIRSGMVFPMIILHLGTLVFAAVLTLLEFLNTNQWNNGLFFSHLFTMLSLIYVPIITVVSIMCFTPKQGFLRRLLDKIIIKIPVLGSAVKHLNMSRFYRAIHVLMNAGMPIAECVERACNATDNSAIKAYYANGAKAALKGVNASLGFSKQIPQYMQDLWATGEVTGKMDDTSTKLANINQEISDRQFAAVERLVPKTIYFFVSALTIYMLYTIAKIYIDIINGLVGSM